MKYYTLRKIRDGLNDCVINSSPSREALKKFILNQQLALAVEDIYSTAEIIKYNLSGVKYLIPHSHLQAIIDGFQLPINISRLEKALER